MLTIAALSSPHNLDNGLLLFSYTAGLNLERENHVVYGSSRFRIACTVRAIPDVSGCDFIDDGAQIDRMRRLAGKA